MVSFQREATSSPHKVSSPDRSRQARVRHQERFVASVAESLDEAEMSPGARPWYGATYAGEQPVGFVMLSDDISPGDPEQRFRYILWRLLIDARWQRYGYGRAAMALLIDHLRDHPGPPSSSRPSIRAGFARPYLPSTGLRANRRGLEGEAVYRLALEPDPEV